MGADAATGASLGQKPLPPDADDYSGGCDSGCTPCIYDLYWEALARYEQALAEWRSRQPTEGS